jgi:hypothetical protein
MRQKKGKEQHTAERLVIQLSYHTLPPHHLWARVGLLYVLAVLKVSYPI